MRSSTFQDSVPKNRCRGKDPSSKTPLWTFITVFFLTMFLNLGVQGQNLYSTCTGCTSEDIKATSIRFDPPINASCLNSDQNFDAQLYVGLDVTSNTRYGLYIEFYIEVNGTLWPSAQSPTRYAYCVKQDLPQGQYEVLVGTVPGLPGGSSIRLVDVFTGWENQSPNVGGGNGKYFCDKVGFPGSITCSDIDKPRCKSYPFLGETVLLSKPTVTVTGPEAACTGSTGNSFTITGTASTPAYEIELYYSFTGGAPYTKVDNFDGSETIAAASPFGLSQTLTAYLVRLKPGDDPCPGTADAHTITSNPAATVDAGPNKEYCSSGAAVALGGSFGGGASSATWTGGAGTFAPNANSPTASYTPTAGEVNAGSVTLTLTTNDPAGPCPAVSDWMVIATSKAAVTNAGDDQTKCSSSAATVLNGSVSGGSTTGTWSGGAGSFAPNATTLNATYTPTAGEIAAGSVTLTLTSGDPVGLCAATSDWMVITINQAATVEAGADKESCSTSPAVVLAGSYGGGASSATWTGGGGSYSPSNNPTATYTPSADEIAAGSVTLTLTTNDPTGPCNAVSDWMVVRIRPAATVNANIDQTVCAASPAVTLAGSFGGGASSATWTGGAGSFSPSNNPTATYTPTAGEISAGSVTLTLTTNDPTGPCNAVSDWMVITINANSSANAGPDQTVCANQTVQLAATSTPSTGAWTGGAGSYAPNNTTANAVYTPTTSEKTAGTVTLTWTTTDPPGPCTQASDWMVITINPIATVSAGDDKEVCSSSPAVALGGSFGGGASSATWTGGAGSFSPSNNPTATYTPTAGEISAGSVTLTLTTNNPAGPCDAVSDWMVIRIYPAATADAGQDQTVCANQTVQLAATYGGGASSGSWTGGGGSYNPSAAAGNAVYTPSPAEKTAGSVTLTWTTNNPTGPCNAASDMVTITINPIATVNAGNDQSTCVGVGVTLTATLGGSASSVTWATVPSGLGTFTNASGNSVTFTPNTTGAITVRATTNDPAGPCAAATDDVIVTANTCAAGYCTYTQGGFGNEGGKDSYKKGSQCIKSTGATMTVGDALDGWGMAGMQISNMNFKKSNVGDVALIIAYLPNGGPSKAYTGTKANLLTDGDKNTLLAQTMTLGLNLGLNASLGSFVLENKWLVTASSDDCGETPDGLTTQCFKFSIVAGMDVNGGGVTVREIFDLANKALRGEALPAGVTLSNLAGAADMVNNAFDECRVPLRWSERDECSGARNTLADANTATFGTSANRTAVTGKDLMVKAYPNPFKDRVFISFTSPVSGKATVEIFDMSGRRLETINKGQVVAGRENTVEYTVPSTNRNSIIYRVTVDKFSVNGRLVSPGLNR